MKNKFKLLAVGLGFLVLPINTYAANYSLIGSTSSNVATYEIKYKAEELAEGETSETTQKEEVTFKIEKPNDGLTYTIERASTVLGECYNSDLSCTVSTIEGAFTDGTVLATVTITNDTYEDKTTTIKVSGFEDTKTDISLPGKVEQTTQPKSSDATLSNITLSMGTMDQPFNKDITTYNVTGIKDTVNKVQVTPNCDNNCTWTLTCPNGECSISNSTYVNLSTGANQVSIIVESEDISLKKTYVLNIYRGEIELNSPYLSNIIIKDSTISPAFDSMQNEYSVIVGLDVESLDLEVIPEDPNAYVVIKGNEALIEGENTVTITVTSSDGQNVQVYTLKVMKQEIEEEKEEESDKKEIKTNKVEKKKNNTLLIIILSIVGLGLIIGAYIIIFKIRKNKKNKNDKNDKNNPTSTNNKEDKDVEDTEEVEKTTKEKIDEVTKELVIPTIDDEPKQDVDEALDDLMRTKKLELGDLDF